MNNNDTVTYAVGNGEITLTKYDAEELRIILQTEYLRSVVKELIDEHEDCFKFNSPSTKNRFIDEIVEMNDDCINYDSSYYAEMLQENIFNLGNKHRFTR